MKPQIIIRSEAGDDLRSTFAWYENQEKGLGVEFLRCVDASMFSISRSPKIFPSLYKGMRRALIRRFPYGIFFILEERRIVVLAVLHVKRHPLRWQKKKRVRIKRARHF